MLPQSFWLCLEPSQKISLMHLASGLGNPSAVARWEKIPEAVEKFLMDIPDFTADMIPEWTPPVEVWKTIWVMVGHPCQKVPAPFMLTQLHVKEGEERKWAKLHRIEVTKNLGNFGMAHLQERGLKLLPSDFYWAVFENQDDEKPVLASDNYFWRRK